jgi:putative oxidoreductase
MSGNELEDDRCQKRERSSVGNNFYSLSLALLRFFYAFLFWQHGAQKLLGFFGGEPAPPLSLTWFVGLAEFIGAVAVAVGFLTRPFALILAANMAFLYFGYYLPRGFPPAIETGGEVACLLLLTSLLLVFTGPGRYSVENVLASGHEGGPPNLEKYYPAFLSVFRILIGLLFVQHGVQKLFGMIGGEVEVFLSLRWFAGVIELFGGLAIALGFFTRAVAFLCCGEMAVAYFLVPITRGFWPIQNQGERTILFCYIFMYFWATGPGNFSLDGLLWSRLTRKEQLVGAPH